MSYSDIVLADTPAVLLALDEASGATATDSSGNGHNGTYTGTVTYGETGPISGHTAVKFDANGEYVSTADTFAYPGGNFALEIWFKGSTKPASGEAAILSLGDSVNASLYSPNLTIDASGHVTVHAVDNTGTVSITGATDVTDGSWHHIVATARSGGTLKLYIDGALDDDPVAFGTLWGATALKLWVGAGTGYAHRIGDISGTAAWAALYGHSLTAKRVLAHATDTEPAAPDVPDPTFPTIAGTPSVGHVLRCQPGSWWTDGGATISYQWRRDGSNIGSATSASYTLQAADAGAVIDCNVTATGTPTETQDSDDVTCQASATLDWDPNYRQSWEPDTLLLFDPDQETTFWSGAVEGYEDRAGIFTSTAMSSAWRGGGLITKINGKYRRGIQVSNGSGEIFARGVILPTDQFTVEFFVKSAAAWSSQDDVDFVTFAASVASVTTVRMAVGCKPDAGGLRLRATGVGFDEDLVVGLLPAATWISVAFTYDGTTLRLYIDGDDAGEADIAAPPFTWSDDIGIRLLSWTNHGVGAGSNWQLSDLRVSRVCRTPFTTADVTAASTVAFSSSSTEDTSPYLAGGVHHMPVDSSYLSVETDVGLVIARHDKLDSAVPIVAGAPDTDHPVAGASGDFSYNMGPVNHLCDYLAARNLALYLNFGSCPQILGGSVAPLSLVDCADPDVIGGDETAWAPDVPSGTADYVSICTDIYQYIRDTYPSQAIPYVGYANEPDLGGSTFWEGTPAQLFAVYEALADAIKAIDSTQAVGGIELNDWINNYATWAQAFIDYCGDHTVPLDFVSWHDYSGDLNQSAKIADQALTLASDNSLPEPALLIGECNWNGFGMATFPYRETNMAINDWSAAWVIAHALALRHAGVTARFHFFLGDTADTATGADGLETAAGVFDTDNPQPWAAANALRVVHLLTE